MTRSVWLACISNGDNGSFFRRDSALADGVAARFQPLKLTAYRMRSLLLSFEFLCFSV